MTDSKIVQVDSTHPNPVDILRAGKIIDNNGVVIFPAKCLYGVAANALDSKAVEKVFNLKKRPLDNPILVLIPDRGCLHDLVQSVPESAEKLMDAFWPGNLTLVFAAQNHIPRQLTAGTGKIGIRVPVHPVAKSLVRAVGYPITGTSANLSGEKSCNQAEKLDPSILKHADMVLDAGLVKGGKGSSIVDVTTSPPTILREGEVPAIKIKDLFNKNERPGDDFRSQSY